MNSVVIQPEVIKALADCIVDVIEKIDWNAIDWQAVAESAVKDRPTGKWIPVSERFPEKSGDYLVTVDYGNDIGRMCQHRYFFSKGIGWEDEYISAWMPLPEPYKGAENEEV